MPEEKVIKLIISTHGGSLSNCEKMLNQLLKHKAGYVAYIKNECYSAGALLALGAKELVMDENSYLERLRSTDQKRREKLFGGNIQSTNRGISKSSYNI